MSRCWFNAGPAPSDVRQEYGVDLVSSSNRKTVEQLLYLRQQLVLTDVTFDTTHKNFYAHQVVLAASSCQLRRKFTDRESKHYEKYITLACDKPKVMSQILDYFYGLPLRIEKSTALALLELAAEFHLETVVSRCSEVLVQILEPSNAVVMCKSAYQNRVTGLLSKVNQYIRRHFAQVSQEKEFLQLSSIELLGVIDTQELGVDEEADVYNAVVKWLKKDSVQRRPVFLEHLQKIRCQLLSPGFLKLQIDSRVVNAAPGCREYLEQVLADRIRNEPVSVTRRTPVIYLAGSHESRLELELYDVQARTWEKLKGVSYFGLCVGAGFMTGIFYLAAYDVNAKCLNVAFYEPLVNAWKPIITIKEVTAVPTVVVVNRYIYIIGDRANDAKGTVRYDAEGRRLERLPEMSVGRKNFTVVAVDDTLYAIGGYDGNSSLTDVECYAPGANKWTSVAPLEIPRQGAAGAVLDGRIYVAGGSRDGNILYVVEQYDTRTSMWLFVKSMLVPRYRASLAAVDGKLYVMGGVAANGECLKTTEVYDPDRNDWEVGVEMSTGRYNCVAVYASWQRVEYSMTNDPTNVIRIHGPKIVH